MITASDLIEALRVCIFLIVIEGLLSVDNALAIVAMANQSVGVLDAFGKTAGQIFPDDFAPLISAFEQLHTGAHQITATFTPPDHLTA